MPAHAEATRRRGRSWLALAVLAGATVTAAAALSAARTGPGPAVAFALGGVPPTDPGAAPTATRPLIRLADGRSDMVEGWLLADGPDVSFDGRTVLFAGRRADEHETRVREMPAAGGAARDVVPCPKGCASPRYLPDGRIVFAAPAESGQEPLFVAGADGADVQRITFGEGRDRAEQVLADGRLAFRREQVDAGGRTASITHLTINPDGSGVAHALPGDPVDPDRPAAGATGADARPASWSRSATSTEPVNGPRQAPPVATSVVDGTKQTGWLLCLDAWLTAENGHAVRHAGSSARVRILESGSGAALGEAPIASDGSFYVEVPADRAVRVVALDAAGQPTGTPSAALWVRPNEHRGCLGCHEPPTLAVINRFPLALHGPTPQALGTRAAPVASEARAR